MDGNILLTDASTNIKITYSRRIRQLDNAVKMYAFDWWPWKLFQQFPLTCWIFEATFIKIHPRSTEPSRHASCFNGQETGKQTIGHLRNLCKNLLHMHADVPHWWGTTLSWQQGLWSPRILQIPLFRNTNGRRLPVLRVPQFGPQNPAYGGAKISRDRPHSEHVFALLVSILRSWHRGSWN